AHRAADVEHVHVLAQKRLQVLQPPLRLGLERLEVLLGLGLTGRAALLHVAREARLVELALLVLAHDRVDEHDLAVGALVDGRLGRLPHGVDHAPALALGASQGAGDFGYGRGLGPVRHGGTAQLLSRMASGRATATASPLRRHSRAASITASVPRLSRASAISGSPLTTDRRKFSRIAMSPSSYWDRWSRAPTSFVRSIGSSSPRRDSSSGGSQYWLSLWSVPFSPSICRLSRGRWAFRDENVAA